MTNTVATVADRLRALAAKRWPLLVGLDGPVAVGKSTLARGLAEHLAADGLPTAVVSADGFLLPAKELEVRGLAGRKGFPESFDREAMEDFLEAARAGQGASAPAYDHAAYDVSPTSRQTTAGAAVVIFEGVNVLGEDLAPFYDLGVYLSADQADVEGWFLQRFTATPFSPVRAAALAPWRPDDGDPGAWGRAVWAAINRPNLEQHISSGRARAGLVLGKAADHTLTVLS